MRLLRRRGPDPLRLEVPRALLEWRRGGAAPLEPRPAPERMRIAIVIPWFFKGSGGHSTIANLVRGLEERGHECSLWLEGDHDGDVEADYKAWFGAMAAPVHGDFSRWDGADVIVATGWQTVHRTLVLPGVAARAYLVQDHEPEFFGTSAERTWAEQTYSLGLHCVCASPWLAGVMRERYGASASSFDLGVRHDLYRPVDVPREEDLVIVYGRAVTARRAVPLALLALEEVHRARIQLFGEHRPLRTRYEQLGALPPEELPRLYSRATVGVVLSMTNPSLVPTEMLACGLPVVDIASDAMVTTFGREGPVVLAEFDPLALAEAVNGLLRDPAERARRSAEGIEWVQQRRWPTAAAQVEAGLREAFAAAA